MTPRVLRRVQMVPRPLDEVFAFFESPENLGRITPDWLNFEMLTPVPLVMKEGAVIDYAIRWLGFRVHWTTLITGYDPPRSFVDQQIRGPYAFWHHTHTFRDCGEATEVADTVRYLLPFGPAGDLAHGVIVSRQLRGIFDYRARAIAGILNERGKTGGEQ